MNRKKNFTLDNKRFGNINEILGFEIIDSKSAIVTANIGKFKKCLPSLLEKPEGPIKNHLGYLFFILSNICWMQGIQFASLQKINKSQATLLSFSNICIPVFDVSWLTFDKILDLTGITQNKSSDKNNLVSFSIDFDALEIGAILIQLSRVAAAALLHEYKAPLFLQANQMKFDELRFESDREKLLEDLKSKTKLAIRLGIFNINYDASQLLEKEAVRISEKKLMNLKMVAMATNLWVRNFQPNGLVVSVSGYMGGTTNSIIEESDAKEYLQRLFKEGSRLRFGVPGEDISKVEILAPKKVQESIHQINKLNEFIRLDMKLGGLVIDAGTINDLKSYLPFSDLRICELKMKPGKDLITKDKIETILKKCGTYEVAFNLEDHAMVMNQFPKAIEF